MRAPRRQKPYADVLLFPIHGVGCLLGICLCNVGHSIGDSRGVITKKHGSVLELLEDCSGKAASGRLCAVELKVFTCKTASCPSMEGTQLHSNP